MWDLEEKLGTPLSNLEEVLMAAGTQNGGLDRATWMKILQRQEAAHHLELQKWHDLLGTAAGLLKQVLYCLCQQFFSRVASTSPFCHKCHNVVTSVTIL
jgi:hypothetical protein